MTKNEQLRVIRDAYNAIPDLQDGWKDVRETLFDMNREQEKQHRRGTPNGCTNGLSVTDGARLFVVRHLLDGYAEPNRFTVDDILSIRNEVLYAQAYAKKFSTELKAWYDEWHLVFKQVDYATLMQSKAA